jgi:hypothetical protein
VGTSQASNFIKQNLSSLECGGSYLVKTLNETSFHMRQMVRFEVEMSASVGGVSLNFGSQYHLLSADQNIPNGNSTVRL